jgi:hypothetical protein
MGFFDDIGGFVTKPFNFIKDTGEKIVNKGETVIDKIGSKFDKFTEAGLNAAENFANKAGGLLDTLQSPLFLIGIGVLAIILIPKLLENGPKYMPIPPPI